MFCSHIYWDENIIFFRANITQNITGDKHQWTNKYQQTGRRRKIWRLCSGSSTKTSESITILQYWKYYNYYRKPVGYILCNDRVTEWDVMFLSNQCYSLTHNFDLTLSINLIFTDWLSAFLGITWTRRNTSRTKIRLMLSTGTTAEGKGVILFFLIPLFVFHNLCWANITITFFLFLSRDEIIKSDIKLFTLVYSN